jgi:dsDNA-specific endonuclease/ATPase MutS2
MDPKELWIGDWLRLKDSSITGKYHGHSGGSNIKIKVGEKVIETSLNNVEKIEEPAFFNPPEIIQEKPVTISKGPSSNTIDLHIEVLAPEMKNGLPLRIRAYQIEACKNFVEKAIESGMPIIKIIHGKGEGILKEEVLHLLSLYDKVRFIIPKNDGGAVEVWL